MLNIWWRDEQGNMVNAAVAPGIDITEEAPYVAPEGTKFVLAPEAPAVAVIEKSILVGEERPPEDIIEE